MSPPGCWAPVRWSSFLRLGLAYLRAASRPSQTIAQVLGGAEPGVWVSDCFSGQLKAPAQQRQLCLAHQLRNLQYGIDAERCRFCYQMQQLLRWALRLDKHRDSLSLHIVVAQVKAIEAACNQLLSGPVSTRNRQRLRRLSPLSPQYCRPLKSRGETR